MIMMAKAFPFALALASVVALAGSLYRNIGFQKIQKGSS
jgi:hypothetical protein